MAASLLSCSLNDRCNGKENARPPTHQKKERHLTADSGVWNKEAKGKRVAEGGVERRAVRAKYSPKELIRRRRTKKKMGKEKLLMARH